MGATNLAKKAGKNLKRLIKTSKYHNKKDFAIAISESVMVVDKWIMFGIDDFNTLNRISSVLEVSVYTLLS